MLYEDFQERRGREIMDPTVATKKLIQRQQEALKVHSDDVYAGVIFRGQNCCFECSRNSTTSWRYLPALSLSMSWPFPTVIDLLYISKQVWKSAALLVFVMSCPSKSGITSRLRFSSFEQVEYLPVVYPSAREQGNPAEFAERVSFSCC